jgi:cytochrome c oxidase accessory protein FixG
MFDRDTLIVAYDDERGEPRGSRPRSADPAQLGLGACIDCNLCFQVCPVGIDIRKGLQYECIGCGACADVCDSMMDKMGYARGLVRYSTQNATQEHWGRAQMLRRVLRPRVLVYSAILGVVSAALMTSLVLRTPFKVDIVRDRSSLARIVSGGRIENVYRLQIMNATESRQTYHLSVSGLPGLTLATEPAVVVEATQAVWTSVRLQLPYDAEKPGSHPFHFEIAAAGTNDRISEKSVFLVPR